MPPRSRVAHILVYHVISTLLVSTGGFTLFAMFPLIARLRFGAGDWQTAMVTAAVPTLLLASIFWSELLRRISPARYLVIHWLTAMLPIAFIAGARNFEHLLICYIVASAGFGGWSPVNGILLKRFYKDSTRGRAYGVLNAAQLIGGMATVWVIGRWQTGDPDAFRIFLPGIVLIQGFGVAILIRLATITEDRTPAAPSEKRPWSGVLAPVFHMHRTLRADRNFLRYEAAFMTYGAGFMICEVLLPVLVTDKLHLNYEEFAERALVAQRLGMLALALPMGWVMDRIGATRTSGLSFAWLGLYPILLLLATGPNGLTAASALFGFAMAGVVVGWMLGPVALAPSPEKVPHYVAIHATLVGFRGILFQGLGMLLYRMSGSFTWPLALASFAFVAGAWQMWKLHGRMRGSPPPQNFKTSARNAATVDRA